MKTVLNIFIALFLTITLATAQDTLYVYKAGLIVYKSPVNTVDSVSFTYIAPISGTLIDNDGHTYNYKKIGAQVWMTENLKTTKYRNGESISNPTVAANFAAAKFGAWCDYDNNPANGDKYGKLYNWYAVNDPRKIAPVGWHVATDAEWNALESYVAANLGTSVSVAKALATTTDWDSSSFDGAIGNQPSLNNYSGFSALPGGCFSSSFIAFAKFSNANWWTATKYLTDSAITRSLDNNSTGFGHIFTSYSDTSMGFSVRCVRD